MAFCQHFSFGTISEYQIVEVSIPWIAVKLNP